MADHKVQVVGLKSVVISSSETYGPPAETFQIPTVEDMQALERLIGGGALLATTPFWVLVRALIHPLADTWDRINFERHASSIPLAEGVSTSDINPLVVTDGQLRTFGNRHALDYTLRRFHEHSVGQRIVGLSPAELIAFAAGPEPASSRVVQLPAGRAILEYTFAGPKANVVYLYDVIFGIERGVQVVNTATGEPVMMHRTMPNGDDIFEQIMHADSFERAVRQIEADIRTQDSSLPPQAVRELAKRVLVAWRGLSEIAMREHLEYEIDTLEREFSRRAPLEPVDGVAKEREILLEEVGVPRNEQKVIEERYGSIDPRGVTYSPVPTFSFVINFLRRPTSVEFKDLVGGMVSGKERGGERDDARYTKDIAKAAERAFRAAGR